MFDLEPAIAEWYLQMLESGIKTPVPLEELEIHLRETIAERITSGLSAEEAFNQAVEAIGSAATLKAEFDKADITRKAFWNSVVRCGILAGLGIMGWYAYAIGYEMALIFLLPVAVFLLASWNMSLREWRAKSRTSEKFGRVFVYFAAVVWIRIVCFCMSSHSRPDPMETIGLSLTAVIPALIFYFATFKRHLHSREVLRQTVQLVSAFLWLTTASVMPYCRSSSQIHLMFLMAIFFGTLCGLLNGLKFGTKQTKQIANS